MGAYERRFCEVSFEDMGGICFGAGLDYDACAGGGGGGGCLFRAADVGWECLQYFVVTSHGYHMVITWLSHGYQRCT